MQVELSKKEKCLLFWASFLALTAAGFGFTFRVIYGGAYGAELGLTNLQQGAVFGASLWPIAITMILGSLIVDKIGYKLPMFFALALQTFSVIGTFLAKDYSLLYYSALAAGLGHGIVECVINPVCSTIYHDCKTKMLTILHAAWPAGLAFGGALMIISDEMGLDSWNYQALWMLLPIIAYGIMFIPCKFPIDERVVAGVSYKDMLKQVGFLGCFIAAFMLIYEIGKQGSDLKFWSVNGDTWFYTSLISGLVVAAVFGIWLKALGKPVFFLFCLMMIPLATAELGTDQWIKKLMTPVLENLDINAGWAIVFSASIMMILRFFAGPFLKFMSPPAILAVSGILSAVGLFWLSGSVGAAIFVAFILYAIGQTFYWPCVLGFVAEQYPKGGALTLNTVSAIGLLSVGILGGQLLGRSFDQSIHSGAKEEAPQIVEASSKTKNFLWMKHEEINPEKKAAELAKLPETEQTVINEKLQKVEVSAGRDVLKFAAFFPLILVVCFGGVAIYYKSRGGYKPVELDGLEQENSGH